MDFMSNLIVLSSYIPPSIYVCCVYNTVTAWGGYGAGVTAVTAASMERREGSEYDFCEPLLERALGSTGFDSGDVIVAVLFLSGAQHIRVLLMSPSPCC